MAGHDCKQMTVVIFHSLHPRLNLDTPTRFGPYATDLTALKSSSLLATAYSFMMLVRVKSSIKSAPIKMSYTRWHTRRMARDGPLVAPTTTSLCGLLRESVSSNTST